MNPVPKITEILSYFKNNWTEVLEAEQLKELSADLGYKWRNRNLGPVETIQLFLLQVLLGNTSCAHLRYFSALEFSPGSYCDARQRLPLELFEELVRVASERIDFSDDREGLWRGHRVWMSDGSGCSMPDTAELQQYFGQPSAQSKGCGFPVAHLLALMDCSTGMLKKLLISPLSTHDLTLASELSSELETGDIIVEDRGFCSSALIIKRMSAGIHSVTRVQSSHKVDFRKSQKNATKGIRRLRIAKLGKTDQLVEWHKSHAKPPWMSEEEFDRLPEKKTLREISYHLDRKGFRSEKIILVTTLTDSKRYSRKDISELYGMRWEIETNFRHLKITMKMDMLKCKTVDGVKKEISMFCLVYNLVRQAMIERAGKYKTPISRISFIDTLRWLRDYDKLLSQAKPVVNPLRPGRKVPRIIKRRPKAYPRMTKPRRITFGITPAEQALMA